MILMIELLAIAALIATCVLLPFTAFAARLFASPPPTLKREAVEHVFRYDLRLISCGAAAGAAIFGLFGPHSDDLPLVGAAAGFCLALFMVLRAPPQGAH